MASSSSCPATSTIPVPPRVVVRGVIQFLNARSFNSAQVHEQLVSVYGQSVMSESMVRRWVREFKAGRHSLEDKEGRGRPSLVTDDMMEKIENAILEDRHLTINKLLTMFPEISRTLIHEIFQKNLIFGKFAPDGF